LPPRPLLLRLGFFPTVLQMRLPPRRRQGKQARHSDSCFRGTCWNPRRTKEPGVRACVRSFLSFFYFFNERIPPRILVLVMSRPSQLVKHANFCLNHVGSGRDVGSIPVRVDTTGITNYCPLAPRPASTTSCNNIPKQLLRYVLRCYQKRVGNPTRIQWCTRVEIYRTCMPTFAHVSKTCLMEAIKTKQHNSCTRSKSYS